MVIVRVSAGYHAGRKPHDGGQVQWNAQLRRRDERRGERVNGRPDRGLSR